MDARNSQWNKWMDNPRMQKLDPAKRELIRMAYEKTRGKSGRALAPVMMSIVTGAGQKGIRFTQDEISLILELLKEGKSDAEKAQIEQMVAFVNGAWKKKN